MITKIIYILFPDNVFYGIYQGDVQDVPPHDAQDQKVMSIPVKDNREYMKERKDEMKSHKSK